MQGRPDSEAHDRKGHLPLPAIMGERSAVRPKSGESVRQSDPGLRRPTPPSTAGRKPAARPPVQFHSAADSKDDFRPREAGGAQRKTGRGAEPRRSVPARSAGLLYPFRSIRFRPPPCPRRFRHQGSDSVLPNSRPLGQGGTWTTSHVVAALDQRIFRSPFWCQPSASGHEARNAPRRSPSANPV